jgi:hypothetical protein
MASRSRASDCRARGRLRVVKPTDTPALTANTRNWRRTMNRAIERQNTVRFTPVKPANLPPSPCG